MRFNMSRPTENSSLSKANSIGAKLFATLFFLVFAGVGIGFIILMIREVVKGKAEWHLLFFLILPLIFAVIGLGGLWGTWFAKPKDKVHRPKSKNAHRTLGYRGQFAFGLVFIIVGLGAFYPLFVRPVFKTWQAKHWVQTPCKIISATVGEHDSDDGTTYSVDITYEYQFDGKSLICSRYDFMGGSSSGYQGKKAVVDRYLKADNPICYVNPKKPSEAVLVREFTAKNLFGLLPLIFVVAGAFVAVHALGRRPRPGQPGWLPSMKLADTQTVENPYAFSGEPVEQTLDSVTLEPNASPLGKLFGIIAICLFWNGIVSVFVCQAVSGFKHGSPEWFLALFLIPFVLVGIGLMGGVVYQFLALFNPRFTLTLQPGRLYPGSAVQFSWQARGRVERIGEFCIRLTGREEATYQVGTNTRTAKHEFFTMELFKTKDTPDIAAGQIGFAIPEETMHSFEANNNKIIWSINLHGDIARWPDTKQDYSITIRPFPLTEEQEKS